MGRGTGFSEGNGTVASLGSGTETGSGVTTSGKDVSSIAGSGTGSTSTETGGTYAVSTSLAEAPLLAKLVIGVTCPATSNAACTSDASDNNASLFAAGLDIKDSTPFRYFVASPSPPVC